jgi:hypothetical protein
LLQLTKQLSVAHREASMRAASPPRAPSPRGYPYYEPRRPSSSYAPADGHMERAYSARMPYHSPERGPPREFQAGLPPSQSQGSFSSAAGPGDHGPAPMWS